MDKTKKQKINKTHNKINFKIILYYTIKYNNKKRVPTYKLT